VIAIVMTSAGDNNNFAELINKTNLAENMKSALHSHPQLDISLVASAPAFPRSLCPKPLGNRFVIQSFTRKITKQHLRK